MNIGMIGVGGFAGGTHLPNAAANPNFRLVALCDLNEARLGELADRYKPDYVTTDMNRVMSDPGIDMVICGTKPSFRVPIMQAAVEHRKHLFVEKPLCYGREDLEVMVPLMREAPITFMVGFNRPYSPMMQALKPIYQRHKQGGNTTIIYRIIGEAQLWPEHHYDAVVRRRESTIIHEATHIFDLLNWLTESMPSRVYTAGGGNMDNVITLTYPDNVTAVVISGDNSTAGFPKERLEIDTNHGTIVAEQFVEIWTAGVEGDSRRLTFPYVDRGETHNDGARGLADALWAWRRSVTDTERAVGYYYERMPKVDKGHYDELEFFRCAIEENGPVPTGVVAGAVADLIGWAAVESWETGSPRDLNFSGLAGGPVCAR